jgi:ubiquinone/menaquinone biosynthesis C-methylase UbiE
MPGVERLEIHDGTSGLEQEHLARYEYARQFVSGLDILDVACGTGYGSQMLAEAGAQSVLGIDISRETVDFARAHYASKKTRFELGDAQNLYEVRNQTVDVVVSFETVEHVPNADAFLAEVSRVLKPGGTFIVSTPDFRQGSFKQRLTGKLRNEFHVREYTGNEFLKVLRNSFEVLEICGQRLTRRVWLSPPIEVLAKAVARLFGQAGARFIRRRYYPEGFAVQPAARNCVPYFWVVRCRKPI